MVAVGFFFFLFFMHDQFNDDYMQNAVDVKGRFWNFSKAKKEREDLILMRRTRESEFFGSILLKDPRSIFSILACKI